MNLAVFSDGNIFSVVLFHVLKVIKVYIKFLCLSLK